jgi:hypothetical protein
MINFYTYIILITIIFILIIAGLYLSKVSPKKIKTITIIIILFMLFKYIALSTLTLTSNIKYLYLLKPFFFLNLISVPLLALTVLYIFIRKDNIKFSHIFIIAAVLIGLYSIIIYKCPSSIENSRINGYTMLFFRDVYIYWIYVVLNTLILFFAIGLVSKKNINKAGMYLVIFSSLVTVLETIFWIIGIITVGENIIGYMLWLITLVYGLNKVKKKNVK